MPSNNKNNKEPSKTAGRFHSAKGSTVEAIGNVVGSAKLQHSGAREHAAGESELNAAKWKSGTHGAGEHMGGRKDTIMGAITGDRDREKQGHKRTDKGQTLLNSSHRK